MSSLTSSRPPSRNSFDYAGYNSQSQPRTHVSNPAHSPHPVASPGIPSTTFSAPTPPGLKQSKQQQQTGSPAGYFGLIVEPGDSTLSLNHTKHNWSPAASSIKSVAARSPRPVTLDNLPLSESFHKQAQALAFSLHQPNFPNGTEQSNASSEYSGDKGSMAPSTSTSYSPPPQGSHPEQDERAGSQPSNSPNAVPQYFQNRPRMASPFSMKADSFGRPHDSLPHLSAPSSPFSPGSLNITGASVTRKAHTLPIPAKDDSITLITPEFLRQLLRNESSNVLLLDLRTYPQYAQSRIEDAVHLCIPTTLLKRPSFNVTKLSETFANDADKKKFLKWRISKYIVVYDADSQTIKDAIPTVHTVNKFVREGWSGHAYVLGGRLNTYPLK